MRPSSASWKLYAQLVVDPAAATAEDTGPKWVQVTREGNFAGYAGGERPFSITRADLQKMVDNIRAHPSYELDASGSPIGKVIPWDYNHASELHPGEGDLPRVGAPAQGWTLDFEIRNGPDGKAQLWALTEFLEPAKTYVKAGQYKWASVSVVFGAVDPVTAQNVGATVTSIALTNTPFVEGMEELVASKTAPGVVKGKSGEPALLYRRTFYEAARSPQDAINCMKEMFGLSETAGAQEVLLELGKVQQWYASGQAPIGTDPEYIIGSLRTILNLPSLEPPATVLEYALSTVPALIADQSITVGVPAPAAVAEGGTVPPVMMPTTAARALHKKDENTMSEQLLKTLSTKLGVILSEAAVLSAVEDLLTLSKGVGELFGLTHANAAVLLADTKKAKGAMEKLKALVAALGVEDPDASVAKVASLMETAQKLKEVMPELEGLRTKEKKHEEESIENDVAAAIAANKSLEGAKDALLLFRRTQPEEFSKKYPRQAPVQQPTVPAGKDALLARSIAEKLNEQNPQGGGATGQVINLAMYTGPNPTARAKSYLASVTDGWSKLDNETQFNMARALRKQPNVIDDPAAVAS